MLTSCTKGFNKDLFLEQVGEMSVTLKGKKEYHLQYDSLEHNVRLNWLKNNAELAHVDDNMEVSDDGMLITLKVLLDDVTFQRYLKEFETELFDE